MARTLICTLGVYYLLSATYLLVFPLHFYENVPGVTLTGSYNTHFIRDIGLAFLISAAGLLWGSVSLKREVAIMGAAWPFLHGLYHLQMWFHKAMPFNTIALSDWIGVIIPGVTAISLSYTLKGGDND